MAVLKVYARSIALLRSEWKLASMLALAGIGLALVQLLEPILFGRVVNALSSQANFAQYLAIWAGMGTFNAIVSVFVAVVADRMAHRRRLAVMEDVFAATIQKPQSFHAKRGSGKLVRIILTGAEQLFMLWLTLLREHVAAFVGIILMIPTALYLNVKLALVLFTLAVVYGVANSVIIRRTHGRQALVEVQHQEIAGRLLDVVNNVTVVQSFQRFSEERQALGEMANAVLRAQYPVLTWWGILNVITRIASTVAMMTIVAIGAWLVARNEVTAGEVVTFAGFSTLLIGRLDQISSYLARAVAQAPTLQHLFELMDHGAPLEPGLTLVPPLAAKGSVSFENVTYRYAPNSPGVFGINFSVSPGQSVALVGPSGSGKTTCIGLLQRMFEPQSGRILVDGVDIKQRSLPCLRGSIAAVFQDAGLFNRSILENIRVGRPEASLAEVEYAAKRAEAYDFIMNKPDGFNYVVGERGLSLSGGERQRIAIARAILKDAPILILDEATSALDNETEKKIQLALDHLRDHKTTFMIAHRLSTIVSADLILVFQAGMIVESGTFGELKRAGGLFESLLRAGQLDEMDKPKVGPAGPTLQPPTQAM
jgi:glucan exporter ATP-binding protein